MLGVDPVKNLVVPRFLALMVVTGLFDIYSLLFGIFGGILAELVSGQSLGPFWNTLFANSSTVDLWGSVLKTTMFGAIIAIVCCYKGMSASGGAEGVGKRTTASVVSIPLVEITSGLSSALPRLSTSRVTVVIRSPALRPMR